MIRYIEKNHEIPEMTSERSESSYYLETDSEEKDGVL